MFCGASNDQICRLNCTVRCETGRQLVLEKLSAGFIVCESEKV
jgi:hypothetical protein